MTVAIAQHIAPTFDFPVVFTRKAFDPASPVLADIFARAGAGPRKVGVVCDAGLVAADPGLPGRVMAYAAAHAEVMSLVESPLILPGGEAAKADFTVVQAVWELTFRGKLCRQSFVLAIGGGAFLDAAGFGAATAHRGVRLIRMPTTVLAQNDAGVGVKNGINYFGRKNYIGAFAAPYAVVNDHALLATLPRRDVLAGLAEAVKVALVRDPLFFARLVELAPRLAAGDDEALFEANVRCAEAHLQHIAGGGDPFELGSARPLDFGHWSAHALEEATRGELRHGEAVAVGIALDTLYSCRTGLLSRAEAEQALALLDALGLAVWHPALADLDMAAAIEAFREHLGGRLHLSMLTGLGQRIEVHAVDLPQLEAARAELATRGGGMPPAARRGAASPGPLRRGA